MKRIAIITGAGPTLGTGHLQRMALLAHYLQADGNYEVNLVTEALLPDELEDLRHSEVSQTTSLIIRDMRDSDKDEMDRLQKIAPVLALDDAGPGGSLADHRLNLLPSPPGAQNDRDYNPSLFLYGYNFARSLKKLENRQLQRSIDLVIYPGANPSEKTLARYRDLIPSGKSAGFFYNNLFQVTGSQSLPQKLENSFAGILLSSRVLLTYFGISLFEGHAAGCRLGVLDPGDYHNSLTSQIDWSTLYNLGTWQDIDTKKVKTEIGQIIEETENRPSKPGEMYRDIIERCSRVKDIINAIIS